MEIKIKDLITEKISGEWGEAPSNGIGVKILRTTNFTNLGKIDYSNVVLRTIDQKKIDQKKLIHGDVIIEKSGGSPTQPVGRVVYFDKNDDEIYLCNNFTTVLRPDIKKVDSKYLFYQLFIGHTRGKTLKYQNKTTGIINLKIDDYLNEKVIVPSINDQIRIAYILTQAETLIQQRKESIDLLDEFVKSTFYKMFGDPVINEKKWQLVSLSQLGSLDRGVSKNRPRNASELLGGKYPLIQTGEVSNSGLFIKEYKNTYSELGLKQSKLWDEGTMLITIAANIAQTSILSFKACFPDSIVGFISNKKESNVIYVHHLFSFFQKMLEYNAPSSAQKNINLKILRELIVPKPPLDLQNQFANIVEKTEILKSQFKDSLNELENLFGALSQKAFKGELLSPNYLTTTKTVKVEKLIKKEKDSPVTMDIDKLITPQMQEFIKRTDALTKMIPKTPATIKLPSNIEKISQQIQQINKMMDPFKGMAELPDSVVKSMRSIDAIKSITSKLQERKKIEESKITWEQVNFQQISNWIKNKYQGYHFNSEMLFRFLMEEHVTFPNYFSSEELKTNPKLNEADDVKAFIFSALNNENPFVKLEQVFYDESVKNNRIKLTDEDIEYFEKNKLKVNSGIYFKIVE